MACLLYLSIARARCLYFFLLLSFLVLLFCVLCFFFLLRASGSCLGTTDERFADELVIGNTVFEIDSTNTDTSVVYTYLRPWLNTVSRPVYYQVYLVTLHAFLLIACFLSVMSRLVFLYFLPTGACGVFSAYRVRLRANALPNVLPAINVS